MHFSLALVAAALALQAEAFLIPPQIENAADAAMGQLEALWSSVPQLYTLDCPGCPFADVDENGLQWTDGVENQIELVIRVDDEQRLEINNVPVFPLDLSAPLSLDLVAHQLRTSDISLGAPVPVSFALEVLPETTTGEEPEKSLLRAKFTILNLAGKPVTVDTVQIDLIEVSQGKTTTLHIAKISTIPFEDTPGARSCEGSSTWSLCRVRAIITARLQEMLEAAKQRAQAAKSWMTKPAGCGGKKKFGKHGHKEHKGHKDGHHGHKGHKDGHHGHKEHKGAHHHHKHHKGHRIFHRIGHMLHQAIRFFIVPALLGVIGGLMASAIGMLVGQLIVYMWIRFHRNGQRGQLRIVETVLVEDEKDGLLAAAELPPQYEDVEVAVPDEKI